jgi:transcriptional regulator with XRE-family HTH domain
MPNNSSEITAPLADQVACRIRLKQAREAARKEPQDLAEFVGHSTANYYDLEEHNGELYSTISLSELSSLSSALGVKVSDLFEGRNNREAAISPMELMSKVRTYVSATGLSIKEFEDRVGCVIAPALEDSSKVLDWSVDFLRWVCVEIDIDWHLALP